MRRPDRDRLQQLLRYGATSVAATLVTLGVLAVLLVRLTPGWANGIAVGLGSVLSFELNRRWVWKRESSKARGRQLLLFVMMSLLFLGLSNLVVHLAKGAEGHGGAQRELAVESITIAVFGCRWTLQYFFLNNVLFRVTPVPQDR